MNSQALRLFAAAALLLGNMAFSSSRKARQSSAASHLIRMEANRFAPTEIRARAGDTLKFVNGAGGPHNVEFIADSMNAVARRLLEGAMPGGRDKLGPTSGPLILDEDEVYAVVLPNTLREGRYPFLCLPHQTFMRGALTVVR